MYEWLNKMLSMRCLNERIELRTWLIYTLTMWIRMKSLQSSLTAMTPTRLAVSTIFLIMSSKERWAYSIFADRLSVCHGFSIIRYFSLQGIFLLLRLVNVLFDYAYCQLVPLLIGAILWGHCGPLCHALLSLALWT